MLSRALARTKPPQRLFSPQGSSSVQPRAPLQTRATWISTPFRSRRRTTSGPSACPSTSARSTPIARVATWGRTTSPSPIASPRPARCRSATRTARTTSWCAAARRRRATPAP
eukprot:2422800-Prymnesium_polylepis.2